MQCSRRLSGMSLLIALVTTGAMMALGLIPGLAATTSMPAWATTNAVALPEEPFRRGAMLIELVGFSQPEFRGLTTVDGAQHPIFRAFTVNDEPVDLLVYAGPDGGLELRLARTGERIASADHLAYEAQIAVLDWRDASDTAEATMVNVSSDEPKRLKERYGQLAEYVPEVSYWFQPRQHSLGWPTRPNE